MALLMNVLMFAGLFLVLKAFQMICSFSYTTYKSIRIHKSLEHAFYPPLSYRFKYGLLEATGEQWMEVGRLGISLHQKLL